MAEIPATSGSVGVRISVIVPARNEETSIASCLDAILAQSVPPDELIVIDGMSDDRTCEIVRDYSNRESRIRLVVNEARVTPVALNLGLENSRGQILIRIDAHAIPEVDYIERIVAHLDAGDFCGVGGVKVAVGGSTQRSRAIAAALASRFGVGGSAYHYAEAPQEVDHIPFGAYRMSDLRAVGGWDPRLLVNQDFELDYRLRTAGGRLLLDPAIRVKWKSSQTFRDLGYQYARYGAGKAVVARIHPRSVRFRHLLPPAAVVVLSAASVAALTTRRRWPLAPVLPYLGFLLGGAAERRKQEPDLIQVVLAPVALATMHLSWGFGFLRGCLRGVPRQTSDARDDFRNRDLTQAL